MKRFYVVLCLMVSMFVGCIVHAAGVDTSNGLVCQDITVNNNVAAKKCTMSLKVVNGKIDDNKITLTLTLNNLVVHSIELKDDYKRVSQNGTTYVFESTPRYLEEGNHEIGTITFYKIETAKECSIKYTISTSKEDRSCDYKNNLYYDKEGNVVDKEKYDLDCNKHICQKITYKETDYYFDDTGESTDKGTYDSKCGESVKKCVKEDEPLKYYDEKGSETDEETYLKNCFSHSCEQIGETYYGKDGSEIDADEFELTCKTHTCKLVQDTYFGVHSTTVDKLTYQKECGENVCIKLEDGTYFGKDGKQTDEGTYIKECTNIKCEKVGNKYYDNSGKEISEEEFKKVCDKLNTNPKTGSSISIISLATLFILGVAGMIAIKKHDKLV